MARLHSQRPIKRILEVFNHADQRQGVGDVALNVICCETAIRLKSGENRKCLAHTETSLMTQLRHVLPRCKEMSEVEVKADSKANAEFGRD